MGWLIGIPELGIDDGMLIPMPGTSILEAPFPTIQDTIIKLHEAT